jgi:integrase
MRTKIRRRPNGRWYVYAIDDDGIERGHGGHRTQREAKARAAELIADAGRGRYVTPGRLTVGEYLNGEWIESRASADISPGTRDIERTMVAAWITPHIGDVPLQKLAARDLDRLYRTLRERGGRGGTPLRGKSVRNVHALLSKALGDAVRRGHIVANPIAAVDPPARDDSVERTAWTLDETRRFLEVAASDRLAAIWRLALVSGLRRGELLGLRWGDVDEGTVTVARQVLVRPRSTGLARRVYVRETTKGHRVRRVRIDGETAAALRRWKVAQAEERLAFGPAYKDDGGLGVEAPWVVTEADGAVIHPDTLRRRWTALVATAGVIAITLHSARHTYAELALAAGVRIDVVSRQLGHASIATTANIYAHDNDEAATEASAKIAAALEGGRASN